MTPRIATLSRRLRRARRRGMTLIEIIVVITIISLLTAAVAVAVIPQLEASKRDRARGIDIPAIRQGLDTYYAKDGAPGGTDNDADISSKDPAGGDKK